MFGIPAAVMLVSYHLVLDSLFTFTSRADRMLYAGIAGIVAVQLVIGGFLIFAFTEGEGGGSGGAARPKVQYSKPKKSE
jgi:hypothetical protein